MEKQKSENSLEALFDLNENSKKDLVQLGLNVLNVLGILIVGLLFYLGFKYQIFTSEIALKNFLNALGPSAPIAFILIQIVQTVIPIIPGALTIPMGTMIFGVWNGFLLNFIGIMLGSMMNFFLARQFGKPLIQVLVPEKQYNKYIGWLDQPQRFGKLFTFAMFFPLSPDDFLCYLAGLSSLSFKKYLLILSTSKPLTLFIYSYGMAELLRFFFQLFV